jgi:DNA processing protein
MARGVDTSAHKGALAAKRPTIAVWGTGIDVIYSKENKSLSEQIIAVSEFPLGVFPAPQNFPKRNRIRSGMSTGVLVIEAAEYSGTRVTARCAIEQNCYVYTVFGNVTTKNALGPNMLIKQGAKLTPRGKMCGKSCRRLFAFNARANILLHRKSTLLHLYLRKSPFLRMKPASCRLCATMRRFSLTRSWKSLSLNSATAEVFTALFELELSGRIRQLPGKNYVKTF